MNKPEQKAAEQKQTAAGQEQIEKNELSDEELEQTAGGFHPHIIQIP